MINVSQKRNYGSVAYGSHRKSPAAAPHAHFIIHAPRYAYVTTYPASVNHYMNL